MCMCLCVPLCACVCVRVRVCVCVLCIQVGVDATQIKVTTTATGTTLALTVKVEGSSTEQGKKVKAMLDKSDPSRRDNAKPLGIKSLTSNPAARADSKLPITGTTSNVAVTFSVVPKDTKYAVMIEVTMPYSKAEFDADKQVLPFALTHRLHSLRLVSSWR